jgi:hypothetical protein
MVLTLLNDRCVAAFREAAGYGALYEMGLRLLAEKVPELASLSMTKNLQDLEDKTKEVFAAHLTEDG